MISNIIQVGAFRQEPSDESDSIFDGGFFPPGEGSAEERLGVEAGIDFPMEAIFEAVVVSEREAERSGNRIKDTTESEIRSVRGFVEDFGEFGEAGGAVHGDLESGRALTDHEVNFPMAWPLPKISFRRSFRKGSPCRNGMKFFAGRAEESLGVMARKASNKVRSLAINPLIDGFMADDFRACFFCQTACDDLGGPAAADPGFDLSSQGGVL